VQAKVMKPRPSPSSSSARLAADVVGDPRLKAEPLLADVFEFVEARYHERISLRDVASAVNLSPAHLTTTVRRKTGRTVQEWIFERRMAQARRLLVETDLTVQEIGQKVGARRARLLRQDLPAQPRHHRKSLAPRGSMNHTAQITPTDRAVLDTDCVRPRLPLAIKGASRTSGRACSLGTN
jgi:AraC-like DNA-binding protein